MMKAVYACVFTACEEKHTLASEKWRESPRHRLQEVLQAWREAVEVNTALHQTFNSCGWNTAATAATAAAHTNSPQWNCT